MDTVEGMWDEFARRILAPMNVSENQYTETRRAFYGGAWCMLSAMQRIGEDDVNEDAGVAYLQSRHAEIVKFYEDVKAGLK